jgi:transposase
LPANDRQAFCRIKHLPLAGRGHRLQALPPASAWAPQERPVARREVVVRPPAPAASIIANSCPALAIAAAVFALLALITGLVALCAWLEPTYGVFPALSIVGGVLAEARLRRADKVSRCVTCKLLGDKDYGSDAIRNDLAKRGIEPVIPLRPNRTTPIEYDRDAYKRRNLIKRCVNRLKQFRRIATRYEKNCQSLRLDALYCSCNALDQTVNTA